MTVYTYPLKILLLFTSATYIQVHFRLDFMMEANTMGPDQTAPWRSDLGPYCLEYRLHKNIRKLESRWQLS